MQIKNAAVLVLHVLTSSTSLSKAIIVRGAVTVMLAPTVLPTGDASLMYP